MKKRRILIANDASVLGTGYGVYGKELLSRLNATGKYEIAEIACYTSSDNIQEYNPGWTVYPGVPPSTATDDQKKAYSSDPKSPFGAWAFTNAILLFQPDIVFDMRDYWMYSFQENHPLRKFYKWVVMPTVDSAPQKTEWLYTFENMDLVIPYTEWAKKTLTDQCGDSINLFDKVVNAGVNLEEFTPLDPEEKKKLKGQMFGDSDLHITGCVMRNQKRKLFPNIFKSYRMYLDQLLEEGKTEEYNKSYLFLHTTWPEMQGWDIPQLLLEHDMLYKTYFTSLCRKCRKCFATKFHEQHLYCQDCNEYSIVMPGPAISFDTQSLVKVYQVFDLFLQVAICEGFGMPQVEAAACGVPIASVDYSAMTEIVRNLEGYPIMVETLFRELETGADRAYPVDADIAGIVYDYFQLTDEERQEKQKRTRELCEKFYGWDLVAETWDAALSSVDLSDKLAWDAPMREVSRVKVPANLEPYELVKFIVDNIIQEPELINTAPIQNMIRAFGCGIDNGKGAQVNLDSVIKNLEHYIVRKINAEEARIRACRK